MTYFSKNNIRFHFKIFLLSGLLSTSAMAQQYFFKNYSVESGLPFIQVYCMFQDSNGYLWSGGYGGLSRFDGKDFVNYNRKNGLIDHNVNAIASDAHGRIFAGTNKGLSILQNARFKNFDSFPNFPAPNISSFCKGYHQSMYIGTSRGLYMFKDDQVKPVGKFKGYEINCLFNPDTTVIFAGTNKGVVIFGHNTFKVLNKASGLANDKVLCLSRFKNYLAIGTAGGLTLFNLENYRFTNYHIAQGLVDENINAMVNQGDKYLWIGTTGGLMRFDGNQISYFNIASGNNSNQVRSIIRDREKNIWLGTHSGLYRYRDNSFSSFENVPLLGTSMIFQIFRDRRSRLWVCTQNNGIFCRTGEFFRQYSSKDGVTGNISHAAIEDSEGRLIFGADNGLVQFREDRFEPIALPQQYRGPCEVMYEDAQRNLWIGGTGCFLKIKWINNRPQISYYEVKENKEAAVYGFCEDELGRLYIGTFRGGLFRMAADSIENISAKLKLNEETFFTLRHLRGQIFAASLNGVLVFDSKTNKLTRITDSDGLNSELVYSIEFSRDMNSLWVGTNQGINRLDLPKFMNEKKVKIEAYGKQEGFTGVECNGNGIWEDADGTLWFGTVGGLIIHQPFNFRRNRTENKTLIQNIKLLNEDSLLNDSVELPYDYNVISFYFKGICFTNPDKVLYQRKLVGLDKDWSVPNNEDFIKYSNLAPGLYTFLLKSANNEGIWNYKPTSFTFRIKSPFYLTWWFLTICFVLVFGGIYLVFIVRIYNIKKKQKREYERRVEMSKIELKALRSQMNPHFIFNSLNAIQHYIFNTKSDEAIKYLNKFARLVRIILNNSEKPTVTVGDDLEALKLYLELEQMRFEEKFDYEILIDESVDVDYDIMPPLLMQPYVENAILHGLNPKPGKGKLQIKLHSENNFLICTISDNGIGREKASEIRRTMPVKKHKSLGMKITEDRLKILNEINNSQLSVTITDMKGPGGEALGTRVELFVPLNG